MTRSLFRYLMLSISAACVMSFALLSPPRNLRHKSLSFSNGKQVSFVECFQQSPAPTRKSFLMASENDDTDTIERRGPMVNFRLLRQNIFNQVLVGWTIWTGGYGAQVLARDAKFGPVALLLGIASVVPLIFVSRFVERSEQPSLADLNVSTNMLVLRLFGNRRQPLVAFAVSALMAGLTGLVEETTFRGGILPALATRFGSLPLGIALSTLVFAVLHINPLALFKGGEAGKDALVLVAYQIVTGLIFASLFLLTGNLAVAIIAHALYDFYVFFVTHLTVTSQMEYAQKETDMPFAEQSVESKWIDERGEKFVRGARESFYLADSNRDGVLTRAELRVALFSYGIRLTLDESEIVTRDADLDQSGAIDFAEFLEYIGPSGSTTKAINNSLLGVNWS